MYYSEQYIYEWPKFIKICMCERRFQKNFGNILEKTVSHMKFPLKKKLMVLSEIYFLIVNTEKNKV